jgi:hypothetical protein
VATLRPLKLSPLCRSNGIIAHAVDFQEGVTEAIGSGVIIPKNRQILLPQTQITPSQMLPSRLSTSLP